MQKLEWTGTFLYQNFSNLWRKIKMACPGMKKQQWFKSMFRICLHPGKPFPSKISGIYCNTSFSLKYKLSCETGWNILFSYTFNWITAQKYAIFNISENSRKSHIVDLANDVFGNFPPEAMMNTFSSYEAAYWLERISYNFLIWTPPKSLCEHGF